jgi:hypothetical protein
MHPIDISVDILGQEGYISTIYVVQLDLLLLPDSVTPGGCGLAKLLSHYSIFELNEYIIPTHSKIPSIATITVFSSNLSGFGLITCLIKIITHLTLSVDCIAVSS